MPTIIIASGKFHGKVSHSQFLIDGDLTPNARIAGVIRRILFPSVVTELSRLGDGVEDPQPLAGARVESSNVAFDVGLAARHAAGAVRCADNHGVAGYNRCGM